MCSRALRAIPGLIHSRRATAANRWLRLPRSNCPSACCQPGRTILHPRSRRCRSWTPRRSSPQSWPRTAARYAAFLADLAPSPEQTRITVPLVEFDWRLEGEGADGNGADGNGAGWQRVTVPHYGGPLGAATAYYRTEFEVTDPMLAKGALFVHFNGVDYKAHVFVNGALPRLARGVFRPVRVRFTAAAAPGTNTLLVLVENDAICMGNDSWGDRRRPYEGDKIYAATGPGYDEPVVGWHHCPPGMGIYQDVCVEARRGHPCPRHLCASLLDEARAEAWIEVYNSAAAARRSAHRAVVFRPELSRAHGLRASRGYDCPARPGRRSITTACPSRSPNAAAVGAGRALAVPAPGASAGRTGRALDARTCQFGMRSFESDEAARPKGRLLPERPRDRLRGANTMGFEQQDVMRKDWDQLRDDILLAKICNMNFLRLTQRPVQAEVYDYCDRLGLMTQTDLPLFGVLRRNQFCEACGRPSEMERLVRGHPCNIMVTYINEPFPAGWGKPHRHLLAAELESFFEAADQAVRLENPDRVIKPVDGDYDPPGPGLPDNHCYCGWYNGHGVDLGALHRGYWQPVKPGWRYGCGEFGAEGLDPVERHAQALSRRLAARSRRGGADLDARPDRRKRRPAGSTTCGSTRSTRSPDWVARQPGAPGLGHPADDRGLPPRRAHEHLRHPPVHRRVPLGLDEDDHGRGAPAKTRVLRLPRRAHAAARQPAHRPLRVLERRDDAVRGVGLQRPRHGRRGSGAALPTGDRRSAGIGREPHVCFSQRAPATIPACTPAFQGYVEMAAPEVEARTHATVRLALVDADGAVLHDAALDVEVFPRVEMKGGLVGVIDGPEGPAARLARELGLEVAALLEGVTNTILIGDMDRYPQRADAVMQAVEDGAPAVFLALPPGQHRIAVETVDVLRCGMKRGTLPRAPPVTR